MRSYLPVPLLRAAAPLIRNLQLALCLLPAACSGSGDDSTLGGAWAIDVEATLAANQEQIDGQVARLPASEREDAREQLEGIFEGMAGTIELKADGTLVSRTSFAGQDQEMTGTWEADGRTVTTRARAEGGVGEQLLTGSLEAGQLTLSDGGNQIIVLRRD